MLKDGWAALASGILLSLKRDDVVMTGTVDEKFRRSLGSRLLTLLFLLGFRRSQFVYWR